MNDLWLRQQSRPPAGLQESPAAEGRFDRLVPGVVAILLLCTYAPVLVASYGFMDDYSLLAEGLQGGTGIEKYVIACGRPVYAVLLFLSFHGLREIQHLVYLRLLGILGLAWVACRIYRALVAAGSSRTQSLCLALIITAMPAFQVYAAWATTAFYVVATLGAGCAWWLADRSYASSTPSSRWPTALAAALVLLVAITVHQSAAMFYWVFVAIAVFRPDGTPRRAAAQLFWSGSIGGGALALGFAVFKLGTRIYGTLSRLEGARQTFTWRGKASWFLNEPVVNALNLGKLFPGHRLAMVIALFLAVGLLLYFRGPIRHRLQLFLMALLLVPLSYAPNLLVAENWASYRTISALSGLCVVYTFLALQGFARVRPLRVGERFLTPLLGGAAVVCLLLASRQVQIYFAGPQSRELERLGRQLRQSDLARAKGVYLIRPRRPAYAERRYDEFGTPSSMQDWVPKPMVYLVLREIDPRWANLPVEDFGPDARLNPPSSTVVVDMR
jgi:hypothetical protein